MMPASPHSADGASARALVPNDLATRWLLRWTRLLSAHKWLLAAVLLAQAVTFSAFSAWILWQPDVLLFFSADSAEVRNLREVAQKPGLANQLRLDVHLAGPVQTHEKQTVAATTRELAAALSATHQFNSVWIGADFSDLAAAYSKLLAQAPLLLTDDERSQIESRATPEFLQKRFAAVHARLPDPDGEFLARQLAADPLDLSGIISARLQALSPGGGDSASLQDGLLMTQDAAGRWHAMIVTDPVSLPSHQKAAEITLAATYAAIDQIRQAHPTANVWLVGAHRGYVENARRIITDVSWISTLGSLAVAIAIALYFRRVAPALLCLLPPIVGVGLTLGLAGIFHVTLPLLLLGFAGLLCGATTDYGIQIIAECRRLFLRQNQQWHRDLPAIAARRMLGPISMSVTTSVTGFAALALSAAPGLRTLGLFVAAATLCIWLVTFLILPAYLGPWVLPRGMGVPPMFSRRENSDEPIDEAAPNQSSFRSRKALYWAGALAFLAITAYLTVGALHVRFNSDPRSLDGSPAALRSDEDAFSKVWGDPRNHAIVLVTASTADAALTQLTHVHDYLSDQQRDGLIQHLTSPASILPDQQTMRDRAAAWKELWTPERQTQLKSALTTVATATGFKPAAFAQYADRITTISPATPEDCLANSPAALFPGFIERSPTVVTLATIGQMRSDVSLRRATAWGPELRMRYPDTIILGGKILFFDATQRARSEGERLLPWCILAILLPLLIYFRRLARAWLVMVCLIVGLLWVLGSAAYFGGGLNLLSLVPMLFTLGVAVDYGIYVWSSPSTDPAQSRLGSTGVCALTTILGSGSLIFAGHPAMRWLGVTLVAGVVGGYLAALFIVAPIARRMAKDTLKRELRTWRRALSGVGRAGVNAALILLTLALLVPVVGEVILARQEPAGAAASRRYPTLLQTGPRQFKAGDSWMRWHPTSEGSGLWEIKLVGGPFDRGAAVAQLASPLDYRIETEMLEQLDLFLPQEWARWLMLRGMGTNMLSLPQYVPLEYQQEIWASAVGAADPHRYLAPSYPRILSYHALHDISQLLIDNPLIVPNTFACTAVISLPAYSAAPTDPAGERGHLWLARNFDFEGGESFARQKSVTYVIPPPGEGIAFAHVAWPGLAGCVTGMNQERVAVFLNAAATSDFRRIGTPTILMARDILQHATSIAEAEQIIRRTQVFVSDIIVVADGKTGEAAIFEKSPAGMDFYPVKNSAVVSNHLITPRFAEDRVNKERITQGTTMQRFGRARELLDELKGKVTAESLAHLLRDKKAIGGNDLGLGNRNAIDGLIACHSVVMDVTAGHMWIAAWPHAEGSFVAVDVMAELKPEIRNPQTENPNAPPIAPDPMMRDGGWQRLLASRAAERQAVEALRAGDVGRAKTFAQMAVELNGKFYFGHELLGRALLQSGDKQGAGRELLRAQELDPPYAKRRVEIAELLTQCKT